MSLPDLPDTVLMEFPETLELPDTAAAVYALNGIVCTEEKKGRHQIPLNLPYFRPPVDECRGT